jgi:hypothetical protein
MAVDAARWTTIRQSSSDGGIGSIAPSANNPDPSSGSQLALFNTQNGKIMVARTGDRSFANDFVSSTDSLADLTKTLAVSSPDAPPPLISSTPTRVSATMQPFSVDFPQI